MSGGEPGSLPRLTRLGSLVALVVLAVLVVISASGAASWPRAAALAAALLVPLALPVPGLIRGDRRTSAWATLCVIPYFVYGLTETIANPAVRYAAGAMLFTSLALFALLIAHLRVTRPSSAVQSASPR